MRARLQRRALSTGEARVEALRPAASAGVGGAAVLQLDGPWYGDGLASRGLVVASLRSAGAAA